MLCWYHLCIHVRSHVQFGIDSPDEIQQEAHIRIVSKNLYNDGRQPVPYGVLDRQMVRLSDSLFCLHGKPIFQNFTMFNIDFIWKKYQLF